MKLGEVVQLKSGGPLMTIQRFQEAHCFRILGYEIERKAYVICEWYDADEKDYVVSRFLPEQLQVRALDLNKMDFRNLREFERDALRRNAE
jgi:uncharacterized protein YodC (DUF2158 family)